MPNYGFAIDLRKCIGCHACTIACKAEHDVPIGVNRCWVKTVEQGEFPETQRFFFPVLCNQCDDAPCVSICPTNALKKRHDGIVDLHSDSCIGCRACMVACPYDQLFIDPGTHTAEKCNFCANRVENQLLPACVIVCPTECRIFGDLDDPNDPLSKLVQHEAVTVRKPEKGTTPKVFYIGADDSVIQPEVAARPLTFKEGAVSLRPIGAPHEDPRSPGDPRVDYDMPHRQAWGLDMAVYLLTKGVSTGAMFLSVLLWSLGYRDSLTTLVGPAVALLFITITAGVLVIDLERPERFYYILLRPNWRSWMTWGAYFLTAHGALCAAWLLAAGAGWTGLLDWLVAPALLISVLATCYTAFLFAQGLARDLWQGPHVVISLGAQAAAEAAAVMLLCAVLLPIAVAPGTRALLASILFGALAVHLALLSIEHLLSPSPTRHHELAVQAILRGPYAIMFWGGAIVGGAVLPLLLLGSAGPATTPMSAAVVSIASVLALGGSFVWEYIWVDAGQCVPNS